jgi:acyl-coenzyme A thioesterase PaaI-like protein
VGARDDMPADASLPHRHPDAPAPGTRIASHYARCVGCGPEHPTGLRMHLTAGDGLTVSGRVPVTADAQGAPGLAHGGLLALALDEVMGALTWLVRVPAVTAHLETTFHRPVPVGTTLHVTGRIDGVAGRRLYASAVGRADAPDGRVAVRARALFVEVPLEHFRTHGRAEDVTAALARADVRAAAEVFEVNP